MLREQQLLPALSNWFADLTQTGCWDFGQRSGVPEWSRHNWLSERASCISHRSLQSNYDGRDGLELPTTVRAIYWSPVPVHVPVLPQGKVNGKFTHQFFHFLTSIIVEQFQSCRWSTRRSVWVLQGPDRTTPLIIMDKGDDWALETRLNRQWSQRDSNVGLVSYSVIYLGRWYSHHAFGDVIKWRLTTEF